MSLRCPELGVCFDYKTSCRPGPGGVFDSLPRPLLRYILLFYAFERNKDAGADYSSDILLSAINEAFY